MGAARSEKVYAATKIDNLSVEDHDSDGLTSDRKIGPPASITAMDSRRSGSASRTLADFVRGSHRKQRADKIITHAFDDKTVWDQTGCSDRVPHDIDLLRKNSASWRLSFIKNASEPILDADPPVHG